MENIRVKPITKAKKDVNTTAVRDSFETPAYAIDLLVPFLMESLPKLSYIWEPAVGSGKMERTLSRAGYVVVGTGLDVKPPYLELNFITQPFNADVPIGMIITNPPFSIKKEFIERAFSYNLPFAFLINADYSGEQIEWVKMGCEKIIPTRRINYLTPNILRRIHEGEVWKIEGKDRGCTLEEYKKNEPVAWRVILDSYAWCHNYKAIEEVPDALLAKYSSSQFHSMWLTYGLNIGRTETFVDLPIKQTKENILCR